MIGPYQFFNPCVENGKSSRNSLQWDWISYKALKTNFEEYKFHIQHYEKLLQSDQTNGQAWTELGHSLQLNKEYLKSFQCYKEAVDQLGSAPVPDLWFGIAQLYYRCGYNQYAERAFKTALSFDDNFHDASKAHYKLGKIYYTIGIPRRALISFRESASRLVSKDPKRANIYLNAGNCYFALDEINNAQSMYTKALKISKSNSNVRKYKAICKMQLGKPLKALSYIRRANRSESTAMTIMLEGYCYFTTGNLSLAREKLEISRRLDLTIEVTMLLLGVVYATEWNIRQAFEMFFEILHTNLSQEAWFNIGILYERCGQLAAAQQSYRQACQNSYNINALNRLKILENYTDVGDYPDYLLPSFDVIFKLFEPQILAPHSIPDIFLQYYDTQQEAIFNQFGLQNFQFGPMQPYIQPQQRPQVRPVARPKAAPIVKKKPPVRQQMTTPSRPKPRPPRPKPAMTKQEPVVKEAPPVLSDSEDSKEYSIGIGPEYQTEIPPMGGLSILDPGCKLEWNPDAIAIEKLDTYLEKAKRKWSVVGLDRKVRFDDQKACMILKAHNYDMIQAMFYIENTLPNSVS